MIGIPPTYSRHSVHSKGNRKIENIITYGVGRVAAARALSDGQLAGLHDYGHSARTITLNLS